MSGSSSRRRARNARARTGRPDGLRHTPRWRRWPGAIAIVALAVLAYLPALRAGFIWDDPDNIPQIPFQRSTTFLRWIWFKLGATQQYYPLAHTMFWIESRLWGTRPFGYHAVNLALHLCAALLMWRVLGQLRVRGAWLAAAVFAVHPVFVESVAWVTEGKNTLSTVFYLAAMTRAITAWRLDERTAPSPAAPPEQAGSICWPAYAGCLACFVAALLSKTATCTLPAAVALIIWWRRGRLSRRDVLALLPMFAIAVGAATLTSGMERWNVGAFGLPELALTVPQRVLIAGRALWFYAAKLALPIRLTFIYPRWNVDPRAAWQWLFPLSAIAILVVLWIARGRIGRGPLTAVLFFAGTLAPALGFTTVYAMRFSFVADHFQYLAAIGLIALATAGLARLPMSPRMRIVGASAILLVLAALTFRQAIPYRDAPALWRDTLAKNPTCFLAMNSLGNDAAARGDAEAALAWYDRSLAVHPDQPEPHLFRAHVLVGDRRYDQADQEYAAAMAVLPGDRRMVAIVAHDRARMSVTRGDLPQAARQFEQFLAQDPGSEEGRLEYAAILQNLNRPQDALAQYQRALELNPDSVAARTGLAQLLFARGFLPDALQAMSEAVEIDPGNPVLANNYGVMLMRAGRAAEAAQQFAHATAEDPVFAEAYDGAGNALEAQGHFTDAARMYRRALELKPMFTAARDHLAHLRARHPGIT